MTDIRYVLRYFALNYPHKNELSKTRLTKMVYLADWKSAQRYNTQITDITWYFDHYGPFVNDVYEVAQSDSKLIIKQEYSAYGSPKEVISLKNSEEQGLRLDRLSRNETLILDDVISNTRSFHWSEFIDYVWYLSNQIAEKIPRS